jgi:hypothetical protein
MTERWLILSAGTIGLMVSIAILALIACGVAGVLTFREIDLMYVLWPSSLILTTSWRTTVRGITLTVIAVVLNCLTYSVIAVLLRAGLLSALKLIKRKERIRNLS